MRHCCSLLATLALFLLLGVTAGASGPDFDLVIGTDLHYISPRITDKGEYFSRMLENGDGKLTQYSEEITDAFLLETVERKPDALILTGDLTFNGAVESHEDLAEKLRDVEQAGIPVLVLTGNHDLYNRNAAAFTGDTFTRIPSAGSPGFHEIYSEFGLDEALSSDEKTLSYIYQLNSATRILMLDFNSLGFPCTLPSSTLEWIEEQLEQAQQDGQFVLAAGHQNLFQHSMFKSNYVVTCSSRLQRIFQQYGVDLFLSGHLHIQHFASENGITEITTTALCLYPCRYALLKAENGHICYETVPVDVAGWAEARGIGDPCLLDFPSFSASAFDERSRSQAQSALAGLDLEEDVREEMIAYAAAVQRGVFSGDMQSAEDLDPDGRLAGLWGSVGNSHGRYLSSSFDSSGGNYNFWRR